MPQNDMLRSLKLNHLVVLFLTRLFSGRRSGAWKHVRMQNAQGRRRFSVLAGLLLLLLQCSGVISSTLETLQLNATEIWHVAQRNLLLRKLYHLGEDDVGYALSFLGHRLASQSGLPWVSLRGQTTEISQLTQAFQQLRLYPASSFMGASIDDGYITAVPTPWKEVTYFLQSYKLTSGNGHGCPENTNLVYDRTQHALECIPIEGIAMTLSCEGESGPWWFAVGLSITAMVLFFIWFIASIVIVVRAIGELQKATAAAATMSQRPTSEEESADV